MCEITYDLQEVQSMQQLRIGETHADLRHTTPVAVPAMATSPTSSMCLHKLRHLIAGVHLFVPCILYILILL